jgi:uncharacterized protein (DUF433 family)
MAMAIPPSPYVDEREGALKMAGTSVSLGSVVAGFKEGESPDQIVESFPTLTLAQVYGAIAYYLENQKLIDDYLAELRRRLERMVPPLSQQDPELYARLMAAQERMGLKRS